MSGSSNTATHTYADNGTYTVNVRVTDDDAGQATSSTAVTVRNVAPTAVNDTYELEKGGTLTVAARGVLGNDVDPVDALTTVLVTDADHGTLTLAADGSFTYHPDTGYTGPDRFTYKAWHGCDESNLATVTLTVQPPPTVAGVQINDGSAQRSMVTRLVVTFSRVVTIAGVR